MRGDSLMVHTFDPLDDPRWGTLVERHPDASVFHTRGWLSSLKRTYGFAPVAFTTSAPGTDLRNALVMCRVRSWVTGDRLVSLPFSDHCDPLIGDGDELSALVIGVDGYRIAGRWKYAEVRPARCRWPIGPPFGTAKTFYLHRVELKADIDALWRGLHPDSIQRRIRRAEREPLTYEEGRSDALVDKLYFLLGLTRRRHLLPQQPRAWLRNLVDCLGSRVCIRIVSKDAEPVAGVLTLTHRDTVVYKYGGSDVRYHRLGGMPLLFWRVIQDAKRDGARELDLGRTDTDNGGLVVFKERWSAKRSELKYWRSPAPVPGPKSDARLRLARRVFYRLPLRLRQAAGDVIYRHLA